MSDAWGIAAYFRLMNANGLTCCYHQADRIGLLAALAEQPRGVAALAQKLSLRPRPVELLLRVLAGAGLALERDTLWSLSPLGVSIFGGPYRHLGNEHWEHLPALLETDEPAMRMDTQVDGEKAYVQQALALMWMCGPAAEAAARELAGALPRDARVLDLGAGSAVWSLAVCRQAPGARAVAVDRAPVLAVAERAATSLGLSDHLTLQPGDIFETPLPDAAYDLVIAANVLHLLDEPLVARLLDRCKRTAKPGGEVWLIDVVPEAEPLAAALYELGLALRTAGGKVHAPARISELVAGAGLTPQPLHILRQPPGVLGVLRVTVPEGRG